MEAKKPGEKLGGEKPKTANNVKLLQGVFFNRRDRNGPIAVGGREGKKKRK